MTQFITGIKQSVKVDDKVLLNVPDVARGTLDPSNILAFVMEETRIISIRNKGWCFRQILSL